MGASHLKTSTDKDGQLDTGTVIDHFSLGYSQEIFSKL